MSEITEFQIKVIPDMHLEKGLMITSFEGFETFRKFLASRNELKEENARLREALESIASIENDLLISRDHLMDLTNHDLAVTIVNDTKLAREALGVK